MFGPDLQLTKNFALHEFAVSRDFPELAAAIEFTTIEIERIRFACAAYLQPVRNEFGMVTITSGKRSPELNVIVGGSIASDHLYMMQPLHSDAGAVDFTVPGVPTGDVAAWLRENFQYKLLIHYPRRRFLHLSFPDSSGQYGVYKKK